eukprot:gene7646-9110_t
MEYLSCLGTAKRLRADVDAYLSKGMQKHLEKDTRKWANRGVVFTTRIKQLDLVRASADVLYNRHNSKLPSEVFVAKQDVAACRAVMAGMPLVTCRRIVAAPPRSRFSWKHLSILESSFAEILFLDNDSVPLTDPEFLFDTREFITTGAVLWPDMLGPACDPEVVSVWSSGSPSSALYGVFGLRRDPALWSHSQEVEAGQMLFNKRRHYRAIRLSHYLTEHGLAQQFAYGDKDTFRYSFLGLRSPFELADFPAFAGRQDGRHFHRCYIAHRWHGEVLFLHGGKKEGHCSGATTFTLSETRDFRPLGGDCVPGNGSAWDMEDLEASGKYRHRPFPLWDRHHQFWQESLLGAGATLEKFL